MASDPKATPPPTTPVAHKQKGVRIFMYPKTIFLFPTLIISLICGGVMWYDEHRHSTAHPPGTVKTIDTSGPRSVLAVPLSKVERFGHTENMAAVLFLVVLAFNLVVIALDFPRFTFVGVILAVLFVLFFALWLGAYFQWDVVRSVRNFFGLLYAYASSGFYFSFAAILTAVFGLIWVTRWLDYWEILPNEILHHHGPLSDLERYPTLNLKFDKEIPDVFEFALLQSGRLVLHVADERKSIVLDNVLFINGKEEALKKLMSRLDVRVTTDQEVPD